jgi:hypothetical protein
MGARRGPAVRNRKAAPIDRGAVSFLHGDERTDGHDIADAYDADKRMILNNGQMSDLMLVEKLDSV